MPREERPKWFAPFIAVALIFCAGAAVECYEGLSDEPEPETFYDHVERMSAPTRARLSGTWRYGDQRSGRARVHAAIERGLATVEPARREALRASLASTLVPQPGDEIVLTLYPKRVDLELPREPAIVGAPVDEWTPGADEAIDEVWHLFDDEVLDQWVRYEDGHRIYRVFRVVDGELAVGVEVHHPEIEVPMRYMLHYRNPEAQTPTAAERLFRPIGTVFAMPLGYATQRNVN